MEPFNQLVGPLTVYIAAVGEAPPAVNAAPAGNWVKLGVTDGGQKIKHAGTLTYFRDDEHQGPVKAVRPEEEIIVTMTLVSLTLEQYAWTLHHSSQVTAAAGPPATKRMHLKRGATPTAFAMLLRGDALSPYGALPGQYVIPRGVFDGEPEPAFTKDARAGLEIEFHALEDDTQSDKKNSLGWLIVQTAS
jgi:hypothetical protein